MTEKIIAFFMAILSFFTFIANGGKYKSTDLNNISYGEEQSQKLDICIPETNSKTMGLIVMVHGGSWQRGDKNYYTKQIKEAAEKYGVMATTVNYRLITHSEPSYTMQDIMDDITASITLCVDIAKERGITVNKVMLRGFSAGGHLALMYAYRHADESPIPVTCVFAESPIADMMDRQIYYNGGSHGLQGGSGGIAWAENLAVIGSHMCGHTYTIDTTNAVIDKEGNIFGWTETPDTMDENAEYIYTISPAHSVTENTVPTLIHHGAKDNIVPLSNVQNLVDSLKANGVKYDFIVSPYGEHGKPDGQTSSKVESKYKQYINDYLK